MSRRVVVTGLGALSSAGADVASFWARVVEGAPAIEPIHEVEGEATPVRHVARVADAWLDEAAAGAGLRRTDRFTKLGALAARQAWAAAQLGSDSVAPARAGVVMGSGLGGLLFQEEQMWRVLQSGELRIHPHSVPRVSPTALVTEIALAHGLRGPGFVVASACASGAHAIGQAFRSIVHGEADVMLAGGAEAPLTRFTLAAFALLGVLGRSEGPPARVCKAFDRRRDGFVIGEGGAALVLEEREHALARGAPIVAELCGYGQALGAHHAVASRPDGADAADAMSRALADAGVDAAGVGYVNAHGTGTVENDLAESRALHTVFGERARSLPVSSIKPIVGHTLGAAGALDAVATCLALRDQVLPPSANCDELDPACDVGVVQGGPRREAVSVALSNSFGFGNVNVSLVFKEAHA